MARTVPWLFWCALFWGAALLVAVPIELALRAIADATRWAHRALVSVLDLCGDLDTRVGVWAGAYDVRSAEEVTRAAKRRKTQQRAGS